MARFETIKRSFRWVNLIRTADACMLQVPAFANTPALLFDNSQQQQLLSGRKLGEDKPKNQLLTMYRQEVIRFEHFYFCICFQLQRRIKEEPKRV